MIAPILIACGERYARCATVAIESWYRHHDQTLFVVCNQPAEALLTGYKGIVPLGTYAKQAMDAVGFYDYYHFQYDYDGQHSRIYSSLKPLIMDLVIEDIAPESLYILGLDADGIFTGNILSRVEEEIEKAGHRYDLYLVERTDPRMLQVFDRKPGGGFTLWRRAGKFIAEFAAGYAGTYTGPKGGSQDLTNLLTHRMPSKILKDPFLHFVSPDQKNPELTDEEIRTFRPAYIHLHGKGSYGRLQRFQRVFEGMG